MQASPEDDEEKDFWHGARSFTQEPTKKSKKSVPKVCFDYVI